MLLTHMPGLWDYLFLFSVYAAGISFSLSTIIIIVVALILKEKKTRQEYLKLWLKTFLIMFGVLFAVVFIAFAMG